MKQILPHLAMFTVKNPDPALWVPNCSVYACYDESALILIDSDNGFTYAVLHAELAACGLLERADRSIFLTHCHIDHSGGARQFGTEFQVYGSRLAADILRHHPNQVLYEQPELVQMSDIHDFPDEERFELGSFVLTTHPLRGHTDDSVAYALTIDDTHCLFTGDLVMPSGILGWQGSVDFSLEQTRLSLEWLLAQKFDLWLTGHDYLDEQTARQVIQGALDKLLE